jgi:acetyl-CoA synthetase
MAELKEHVVRRSGRSRARDILFAADLPKTRSGKIMRRLLRTSRRQDARRHDDAGDPSVIEKLKSEHEEAG